PGAEWTAHFSIAKRFTMAITSDPRRGPSERSFVYHWNLLIAAFLESALAFDDAEAFLGALRGESPNDAKILLSSGSVHETHARMPDRVVTTRSPRGALLANREHANHADDLRAAESYYRQALHVDPSLHEARLRLARVLFLQHKSDEAARELDRL